MDKFLTFPGQQPIYLGDIDFMQESVRQALKNLLISYTGDPDGTAILTGVEVIKEGQDVSWTDGVIAIEGDILPVAGGSITGGADSTLYFQVVSTLSGTRTMKDGTVRQCYQTNVAQVVTTVTDYPVPSFRRAGGTSAQAVVYGFEDTPSNTYSPTYARLANCGGAWILDFRKLVGASNQATLLFDEVKSLPEEIVAKIPDSVPMGYVTGIAFKNVSDEAAADATYFVPITIVFSAAAGRLTVGVYSRFELAAGDIVTGTITLPIF